MDYNSTYEQEIDIKDLMFAVFHKWRPILLVAVILAVLMGGVKGVLTYREENDPEVIEEKDKQYQTDLDTYEKNKDKYQRELENLKTDIKNQEDYLEKSIWINMSPYDVCEARVDLYVTTDYEIMPGMTYQNMDFTDTILQIYQAVLTGSAVMEDIAETVGTEPRYLKELVSASTGTVSGRLNHILTINVKNATKEDADEVLDALLSRLDEMKAQVTASIGEHEISTVNRSSSSSVDLSLVDKQESERERLITLNNNLEDKQKQLDELEEPEKEDSSKVAALKDGAKFAAIGGVLGGGMIAFGVCVIFVMSDKVYSSRELKSRYSAKVLGRFPSSANRRAGKIDRWLNQLEGRAVDCDEEAEFDLIAANIQNYAENMEKLLITGSTSQSVIEKVTEEVRKRVKDLQVVSGENMLQNAETIKKLAGCDGVILVEECKVSQYSFVEQEIEKSKDLNKTVIGCVVFE